MHIERRCPQKTDLFFRAMYFSLRNLKANIDCELASIKNINEIFTYGYKTKSVKLREKTRNKIGEINTILNTIYNNTNASRENLIKILDLYEGLGIMEVHEADTEELYIHKNPLNPDNWK